MRTEAAGSIYSYASQRSAPGTAPTDEAFSSALGSPSIGGEEQQANQVGYSVRSGLSTQTYNALFGVSTTSETEYELPAGWEATDVEGVGKRTGPDGVQWTYTDIGKVLTPQDKSVFGWPCAENDPNGQFAAMIASDRADGTLKGPLTRDQIIGNKEKGIVGLVDRFPADFIDTADVSGLLAKL